MHRRARIRAAVQDLLAPIGPIRRNRTTPLQPTEFPCLAVYARGESANEVSTDRTQRRSLDLYVDGYVLATDTLDEDLDAMAARIEAVIQANRKLGGLAKRVSLAATLADTLNDGAVSAGVVRLHFVVVYETPFGDPES